MPRFKLTSSTPARATAAGRFRRTPGRFRARSTAPSGRSPAGRTSSSTDRAAPTPACTRSAQVAHLDVSTNLPPETLRRRLNDELPADINILAAVAGAAPLSRAPRRGRAPLPVSDCPAPDGVRQGVRLVGEGAARRRRDARGRPAPSSACATFKSFAASTTATTTARPRDRRWCSSSGSTSSRTAISCSSAIEGSHFLWKMVRRMVGVLVEIGRGGLEAGCRRAISRRRVGRAGAPDGAAVRPVSRARVLRGRRRATPPARRDAVTLTTITCRASGTANRGPSTRLRAPSRYVCVLHAHPLGASGSQPDGSRAPSTSRTTSA